MKSVCHGVGNIIDVLCVQKKQSEAVWSISHNALHRGNVLYRPSALGNTDPKKHSSLSSFCCLFYCPLFSSLLYLLLLTRHTHFPIPSFSSNTHTHTHTNTQVLIFAAVACLSQQMAVFISISQNWILMNSAMNNQARNYFPISSHDIPPSLCITGINTLSVLKMLGWCRIWLGL